MSPHEVAVGGPRALVIIGDSNKHLGLFDDLLDEPRVDVMVYPDAGSLPVKALARLSPVLAFALARTRQGIASSYDKVLVLDSALSRMNRRLVEDLRDMAPTAQAVLLNSVDASSVVMAKARHKLSWFSPDQVYSFDSHDVERFGFQPLPPNYYSAREVIADDEPLLDCYFVGGLKGGRGGLLMRIFDHLQENAVAVRFDCKVSEGELAELGTRPGLHTFERGWIAYETILERSAGSRCLLEILQENQRSQTVRYFEAITLNRLLITNNPKVRDLPYFDPEYVRVISDADDIDLDWVRNAPLPDYGYAGDFSPRRLPVLEGYVDGSR